MRVCALGRGRRNDDVIGPGGGVGSGIASLSVVVSVVQMLGARYVWRPVAGRRVHVLGRWVLCTLSHRRRPESGHLVIDHLSAEAGGQGRRDQNSRGHWRCACRLQAALDGKSARNTRPGLPRRRGRSVFSRGTAAVCRGGSLLRTSLAAVGGGQPACALSLHTGPVRRRSAGQSEWAARSCAPEAALRLDGPGRRPERGAQPACRSQVGFSFHVVLPPSDTCMTGVALRGRRMRKKGCAFATIPRASAAQRQGQSAAWRVATDGDADAGAIAPGARGCATVGAAGPSRAGDKRAPRGGRRQAGPWTQTRYPQRRERRNIPGERRAGTGQVSAARAAGGGRPTRTPCSQRAARSVQWAAACGRRRPRARGM